MSYTVHRPSILHRKTREPSRANEESLEGQYQREQAALLAKQARHQETHQRLLRSINPQPEDKAAAWEALVASNSVLASRVQRNAQDGFPSLESASLVGGLPEGTRPWHHSMATQQYSHAEEEAARRRFAAEVAAENQRLAREKEMTKMNEKHARHQPVQDTWYSRGDTHRESQPLFSSGGAAAASIPPTPSAAPQRPSSAYPWAQLAAEVPTAQTQPPQWQPKDSNRQYPWSWQ